MAFKKKTWKDRLSEFPGRRLLTRVSGTADGQMIVDVSRHEGIVSQSGDPFSSANMNDLEQRIADEFDEVNSDLSHQPEFIYDDATGKITGYKTSVGGADTVFPFSNNRFYKYTLKAGNSFPATIVRNDTTYYFVGIIAMEIDTYSWGSVDNGYITAYATISTQANGDIKFETHANKGLTDYTRRGTATAIYMAGVPEFADLPD